ncbi:MAG: RNA polymerase sigma factor, partial [Chloroflexota bacterium]|nr:RNA polymerase sigma factor [Chloroflexota bacterium]
MPAPPTRLALTETSSVEGELAAFFEAHYERMTRLAGLICHVGVPAEDAVQAAMEQAWRQRGSLRDSSRLRWWLDRIVVREAIRMNRRPWWTRLSSQADNYQAALLPDPARELTAERVALTSAFRTLSVEQRTACVLHLHFGYPVAETAELMGAPVETTRSRLRLARHRLCAALV